MSTIDSIVLFDLDGTLTKPRQAMESDMLQVLCNLEPYADIGIVSGSPMKYIREQAGMFLQEFDKHEEAGSTYIMPCNGTQLHVSTGRGYTLQASNSMKSQLGVPAFNSLVRLVTQLQLWAIESAGDQLPLTGTFIQYRESMLNWCPSGRDATPSVRNMFVDYDQGGVFRTKLRNMLLAAMDMYGVYGIDVTLGGSTSLDIYPVGWDKTYALRHVKQYNNIIFVGDKCSPGGNDHTIFEALYPYGNAYSVKGPDDTIKLINDVLLPGLKARKQS